MPSTKRFHFEVCNWQKWLLINFLEQATLGKHKGLGVAPKKKDARKEAAKALLEKLEENGIKLSSSMKSKTVSNTGAGDHEEETTMVAISNKQLWTKCLKLLPTDDDDYVKQLKIFSLNSNTGLPKYQVSIDISTRG